MSGTVHGHKDDVLNAGVAAITCLNDRGFICRVEVWKGFSHRSSRVLVDPLPKLNGLLLRDATLGFTRGKVCNDDCLVSEMLFDLEDNVYDELAAAFLCAVLEIAI